MMSATIFSSTSVSMRLTASAARLAWNRPVLWPLVVGLVVILLAVVPGYLGYRRREQRAAVK
jgi:oligopeptide transport system substrate-binding protein